jgi:hypothetical protein
MNLNLIGVAIPWHKRDRSQLEQAVACVRCRSHA